MENRWPRRHVFATLPLLGLTLYVDIQSHSLELIVGTETKLRRRRPFPQALRDGRAVCTHERWRQGHGGEEQVSGTGDDGAAPAGPWPPGRPLRLPKPTRKHADLLNGRPPACERILEFSEQLAVFRRD